MTLDYDNSQVKKAISLYGKALRAEREFRWEGACELYEECAEAFGEIPKEARKLDGTDVLAFALSGGRIAPSLGSKACERALRLMQLDDPDALHELHADWKRRSTVSGIPSMSEDVLDRIHRRWVVAVEKLEERYPQLVN